MTRTSIRELVESWRPRYLRASRKEKTRILDEFVALTGYHRKSAIRLLRHGYRPPRLDRRGRPRRYAPDVKATLLAVWEAWGYICSKRLAPFLPEIVAVLKRHGELRLRPETERLLLQVSPATIDRLLRPHRPKPLRGRTTTKPGTLLKHQIPVRTFADWDESKPGFLEVDLVAHCGESARGEYLHTLTAVDVDTRWCELEVLPNRSQQAVGRPSTGYVESRLSRFLGLIPTTTAPSSTATSPGTVRPRGSRSPAAVRTKRTTKPTWKRRTGRRCGSWWGTQGTSPRKPWPFLGPSMRTGGCS